MSAPLPDYYKILGVSPSATATEIREAYRRESLRCHPDRFPNATAPERERHTARFQSLADAYYVLSDTSRKADYDVKRSSQSFGGYSDFFGPEGDAEKEQESSANFFQNFFQHAQNAASGSAFGGAAAGAAGAAGGHHEEERTNANGQPEPNGVFGSVFEELLRPEVQRVAPVWTWVGSASGAGLGFIMGNIPGLIGGALLGNRMGAIRDAKGKSVAEVFIKLGAKEKADILRALAMKVLGTMGNSSR